VTERCAVHPDRSAEITCARCGSFACFECVGQSPDRVCARCRYRAAGAPSSRIGQVRVLAALTISHGVIVALYSFIYLGVGALFPFLPPPSTGEEPPAALMTGIMGCFGATHLIPGVFQIIAGVRMLRFRNRTLAMIAYGSGFLTFMGCYCIPTSIALAIWGFILLNDDEVRNAFDQN
jgi:hypothetical protein